MGLIPSPKKLFKVVLQHGWLQSNDWNKYKNNIYIHIYIWNQNASFCLLYQVFLGRDGITNKRACVFLWKWNPGCGGLFKAHPAASCWIELVSEAPTWLKDVFIPNWVNSSAHQDLYYHCCLYHHIIILTMSNQQGSY